MLKSVRYSARCSKSVSFSRRHALIVRKSCSKLNCHLLPFLKVVRILTMSRQLRSFKSRLLLVKNHLMEKKVINFSRVFAEKAFKLYQKVRKKRNTSVDMKGSTSKQLTSRLGKRSKKRHRLGSEVLARPLPDPHRGEIGHNNKPLEQIM